MSETVKILTANKLPIIAILALVSISAALANTSNVSTDSIGDIKYVDLENSRNSITFDPDILRSDIDGTFYIEQASGHDISGTYIETPRSYEITYTRTGYGESIKKVSNGIEVPDGEGGTEIWNKV